MLIKNQILVVLLVFYSSVFSQVPSFLDNNPKWRIDFSFTAFYPCVHTHNYAYYIDGDTTFGNQEYKKVYKHGEFKMESFNFPIPDPGTCDESYFFNELAGFVRQDSLKFYTLTWDNLDTLLYDFDLQIGEITPQTYLFESSGWLVTGVDSILVNGNYYKRFELLSDYGNTFLIQGIGSETGLFESFRSPMGQDAQLMCYAQNEVTYFSLFSAEYCNFNVEIPDRSIMPEMIIYPNPSCNILQIELANFYSEFEILNQLGEILLSGSLDKQSNTIEIESLESGSYFIRILSDQDKKITKFIKL
jgi:hypothetical protein